MDAASQMYEDMEKAFIEMGQGVVTAVLEEISSMGLENTPQNRIEAYLNTKEEMEATIGSKNSLMVRVTFAILDYYIEQDRFQIEILGS